jgi:hypothetical protein
VEWKDYLKVLRPMGMLLLWLLRPFDWAPRCASRSAVQDVHQFPHFLHGLLGELVDMALVDPRRSMTSSDVWTVRATLPEADPAPHDVGHMHYVAEQTVFVAVFRIVVPTDRID